MSKIIELSSLFIEFYLCLNSSGIGKFFGIQFIQFDYNFNEFV